MHVDFSCKSSVCIQISKCLAYNEQSSFVRKVLFGTPAHQRPWNSRAPFPQTQAHQFSPSNPEQQMHTNALTDFLHVTSSSLRHQPARSDTSQLALAPTSSLWLQPAPSGTSHLDHYFLPKPTSSPQAILSSKYTPILSRNSGSPRFPTKLSGPSQLALAPACSLWHQQACSLFSWLERNEQTNWLPT